MFRLAHVTDPHFRGFSGLGPADLASKRAVGLANLIINRSRKHKMALLEALRIDLRAQAPDHLALTGDLSNVSLDGEWRAALAWIDMSGVPPESITVIPGNHDAYVPKVVEGRAFERLFAPYMASDVPRVLPASSGEPSSASSRASCASPIRPQAPRSPVATALETPTSATSSRRWTNG